MAEVRKALDTQLRRHVAIKFLHADLLHDPSFITRFEREAQAIASLHHPNIVQIYDFSTSPSSEAEKPLCYMVMEYVEGQTLAHYIRQTSRVKKYPPASDMLHLFTALGNAIDYAHQTRFPRASSFALAIQEALTMPLSGDLSKTYSLNRSASSPGSQMLTLRTPQVTPLPMGAAPFSPPAEVMPSAQSSMPFNLSQSQPVTPVLASDVVQKDPQQRISSPPPPPPSLAVASPTYTPPKQRLKGWHMAVSALLLIGLLGAGLSAFFLFPRGNTVAIAPQDLRVLCHAGRERPEKSSWRCRRPGQPCH
jgi:hypothetical protein